MSMGFTASVSPEQREFFRRNGFLRLDRVTTDEEVESLRDLYDRIFRERLGEDGGRYFDLGGRRGHDGREVLPQVLGPEERYPELRETLYYRNARRVIAALLDLDESNLEGGGHMILKPPLYGRETPWHQDEAYWPPDKEANSISAWMPLDPATVESGCMRFIPGSHLSPVRRHRHIDDDPAVHGLVTDDVDETAAVPCPLEPGGATFHHCRTLHYAGPNTTTTPRRAYILVMGEPLRDRAVPEDRPWQEEEREALRRLGLPPS